MKRKKRNKLSLPLIKKELIKIIQEARPMHQGILQIILKEIKEQKGEAVAQKLAKELKIPT